MKPNIDGCVSAYIKLAKGKFRATPFSIGPWNVTHQHAGPPIALALREFERNCIDAESSSASPSTYHVARITANLFRPIPVSEIDMETKLDFAGKNVKHLSSTLYDPHAKKELARFTCVAHREIHVATPPLQLPQLHTLPEGFRTVEQSDQVEFPVSRKNQYFEFRCFDIAFHSLETGSLLRIC
jgi:hypothetical protein